MTSAYLDSHYCKNSLFFENKASVCLIHYVNILSNNFFDSDDFIRFEQEIQDGKNIKIHSADVTIVNS